MLKLLCLLLLSAFAAQAQAETIEITDLAGRRLSVERPFQRFILGEGRSIPLLSMLRQGDPTAGLIGMMSRLGATDPALEVQLYERYPHAKDIPLFGLNSADSISVEKIIALAPEIAIFGLGDHGPGAKHSDLLRLMESVGIKVVFIDFRQDPLNNTVPSIKLLGKLFGVEERAAHYVAFHNRRLEAIRQRVATVSHRPTVFVQAHPGRFDCCWGMADGMLGPFVGLVGGRNIADAAALGPTSQHSAEFLLTENPDVWIGTASGVLEEYRAGKAPVALGNGITAEMAADSLKKYLDAPEFRLLRAVQGKRAHSIWHSFYNSPFNIVAVEAFAKWVHPELFQDIDPQATLDQITDRYLPFTLDGTYFATIP